MAKNVIRKCQKKPNYCLHNCKGRFHQHVCLTFFCKTSALTKVQAFWKMAFGKRRTNLSAYIGQIQLAAQFKAKSWWNWMSTPKKKSCWIDTCVNYTNILWAAFHMKVTWSSFLYLKNGLIFFGARKLTKKLFLKSCIVLQTFKCKYWLFFT